MQFFHIISKWDFSRWTSTEGWSILRLSPRDVTSSPLLRNRCLYKKSMREQEVVCVSSDGNADTLSCYFKTPRGILSFLSSFFNILEDVALFFFFFFLSNEVLVWLVLSLGSVLENCRVSNSLKCNYYLSFVVSVKTHYKHLFQGLTRFSRGTVRMIQSWHLLSHEKGV